MSTTRNSPIDISLSQRATQSPNLLFAEPRDNRTPDSSNQTMPANTANNQNVPQPPNMQFRGAMPDPSAGCGLAIQSVTDKILGDNVKDEKPDLEYLNLKIAAIKADCEVLLDSQGNVQKAVLKLLDKTEKEEPNNYPVYIVGVVKCKLERMQQKKP